MIALVLALALVACWPTCLALHDRWTDWGETTYTHGYLVALVCIFLLWRANRGHAPVPCRPNRFALAALLVAGLAWAVAVRSGLVVFEWLLLPAILVVALWAGFGREVARRNVFPVAFLGFALPLWSAVNFVFQWETVYAVRAALRMIGIPSHFDGSVVHIPAGAFEIAGGCSGLHYVIVALAVAALMGELRGDGWGGRVKLLFLALALSVVTNWARVLALILVGHYTHMQHYLITQSHYFFGWALFAAAMAMFFLLERRIEPKPARASPATPVGTPGSGFRWSASVPGVVLALAAFAVLQALSSRPAAAVHGTQPADVGPATTHAVEDVWRPVVAGADSLESAEFQLPEGASIRRHRFRFLSHRQGKELGGFSDNVTNGYETVRHARLGELPATLHVVLDAHGNSWLVAASYSAGSRHYARAIPAQLRQAITSMAKLRSQPAGVTLWRAACVPDCPSAEQRLGRFIITTEFRG